MNNLDSLPKITQSDVQAEIDRRKYFKLNYFFPTIGQYRRELYVPHMAFIKNTSQYRENCLMAANRVGKTETGAYTIAVWLTGLYPDWWVGKRFDRPVNILVAGETGKLVRDSIQKKLLGDPSDKGSGFIPRDYIIECKPKSGIPDAIDTVRVKWGDNQESILQFQSYDQKRTAFQATERDVIWLDEEPPLDIYNECLIRTMTTNGIVISTFTPLKGISDTVLNLQEKASKETASIVNATWDDAPHLGEKEKTELWNALPPYQRDARTKGIPQLGSGAVYPIPESDFVIEPFEIPKHYKWCYGFDVGWNNTAAVWLAHDLDNDVVYVVHDYKKGQSEPAMHAAAIKARGDIKGAIDPASRGRSQKDGEQLAKAYKEQGLNLVLADNTVETGIFEVYERLTTSRLKIFKTCVNTLSEMRIYRRDDKGRIVKEHDHNMDALRYGIRTGLKHADYLTMKKEKPKPVDTSQYRRSSII
jgi:phage terminase large subunit-like protein